MRAVIAVALLAALAACGDSNEQRPEDVRPVRVIQIGVQSAARTVEYAGEVPAATEVLTATYHGPRNVLGTLRLLKAPSADGKTTDWYARTAFTIVPVKLHAVAEELAKDAEKLVAE